MTQAAQVTTLPVPRDNETGDIVESMIAKGDLSKLTPQERTTYYVKVCESVGLNPLTRPFEYIVLNGRLTLYARREATDQLRSLHKVSVEELAESERDGVFIVTAKVRNGDGRTDIAKGAVNLQGLKGEALANALMKAETKAKRRATLSICGLGFLDESEIEGAEVGNGRPKTPTITPPNNGEKKNLPPTVKKVETQPPKPIPAPTADPAEYLKLVTGKLKAAADLGELSEIWERHVVNYAGEILPNDEEDLVLAYRENEARLKG